MLASSDATSDGHLYMLKFVCAAGLNYKAQHPLPPWCDLAPSERHEAREAIPTAEAVPTSHREDDPGYQGCDDGAYAGEA